MQRRLRYLFLCLLLLSLFVFVGCGSATVKDDSNSSAKSESVDGLTKENPIKVDKEEGSVTFLAQVNGKYFFEPTRHGAVFAGGSNGDKAVFRAFVDFESYHNALVEAGAKAGENMTMENKETTFVEGSPLDVAVTWPGAEREYKLDEVIKDSNGKPFDIRFGGNLKAASEKKTGCLICLDSCPVGITSNASYTYGAVEKRKEVAFTANKDILPEDGTFVAVKVKVHK